MWWLLLACARPPLEPPPEPEDPLDWVRAHQGRAVPPEHVDWPFVAQLAVAQGYDGPVEPDPAGLTALLASAPPECVPTWSAEPGGAAVTIPPPFDDDPPDRIAATEAVLVGLLHGVEVVAGCLRPVACEEEPCPEGPEDVPWAGFNVARLDGEWRFRAWRDFTADMPPSW